MWDEWTTLDTSSLNFRLLKYFTLAVFRYFIYELKRLYFSNAHVLTIRCDMFILRICLSSSSFAHVPPAAVFGPPSLTSVRTGFALRSNRTVIRNADGCRAANKTSDLSARQNECHDVVAIEKPSRPENRRRLLAGRTADRDKRMADGTGFRS